MIKLSKEELDTITILISSKNVAGSEVYEESLPKILHFIAPRIIKGKAWFHKKAKERPAIFGPTVCECCGNLFDLDRRRERHETYSLGLFNNSLLINLKDILNICSSCHKIIHGGFRLNEAMFSGRIPIIIHPKSENMDSRIYPWNEAKFLLIEDELYPMSDLHRKFNKEEKEKYAH